MILQWWTSAFWGTDSCKKWSKPQLRQNQSLKSLSTADRTISSISINWCLKISIEFWMRFSRKQQTGNLPGNVQKKNTTKIYKLTLLLMKIKTKWRMQRHILNTLKYSKHQPVRCKIGLHIRNDSEILYSTNIPILLQKEKRLKNSNRKKSELGPGLQYLV